MSREDEVQTMREWLAHWRDSPNWSDSSGQTVPVARATLAHMLDDAERMRAGMKELQSTLLEDRQLSPMARATYAITIGRLLGEAL